MKTFATMVLLVCLTACSNTPKTNPDVVTLDQGTDMQADTSVDASGDVSVDTSNDVQNDPNTEPDAIRDMQPDTPLAAACENWVLDDFQPDIDSGKPDEISGLARSRTYDALWVHNDSGENRARFFSLSFDGQTVNEFTLSGAANIDWEDMVIGPGNGADILYFADTGDNAARTGGQGRPNVQVYAVSEPDPSADATVSPLAEYTFTYPDGAHDCESVFIDPANNDMFFITKENDGMSQVFVARAPLTDGVLEKVVDVQFGTNDVPGNNMNTAAQMSWDGTGIFVRTYSSSLLWKRTNNEPIADVFASNPVVLPIAFEVQGESITVSGDGREMFTMSEGERPPIHRFVCQQ